MIIKTVLVIEHAYSYCFAMFGSTQTGFLELDILKLGSYIIDSARQGSAVPLYEEGYHLILDALLS